MSRVFLAVVTAGCCGVFPLRGEDQTASTEQVSTSTLSEPVAPPAPDYTEGLFQSVAEGSAPKVTWFLDQGANVNAELPHPPPAGLVERVRGTATEYYVVGEDGLTPLMLASAMGNLEVAKVLLKRGADPNKKTRKNKTFALWLAGKNQHVEVMRLLMGITPASEAWYTRIRIDLQSQTAYVWKHGAVTRAVPISSGWGKYATPKGHYVVTNKYRDWTSTVYHVRMPFFLRLSCGDFGLHEGNVPGYPASHGCIRVSKADAGKLFAIIPEGTLVDIE